MSTAVRIHHEYRSQPVVQLQESPTNPRRRFDEHNLAELANSFKAQGVLQPLLVRPLDDDLYEVVAGARRLRAAKLAALETVPVRVVQLSDAACIETQLVENIQRENAHPLEEAFAFHGLLHTEGLHYDIQSLAARTGKNPVFVATRLRLTELIPPIAEAFLADQIGVGHALERWTWERIPRNAATKGSLTRFSPKPKPTPLRQRVRRRPQPPIASNSNGGWQCD